MSYPSEILGRSEAIVQVREIISQIAPTPVNVLITGESGTGKSLIAEQIHRLSPRAPGPFIILNCGAIPETLLESELFGHERGAFTDARSQRRGVFEAGDKGTIFLDEIGEMSLSAQVRLLNVLEQREITRVGSSLPIRVDTRVLAATNRDLQQAVIQGRFRRDLYYRLKVVEIRVPPLRTRREDIPELARSFVAAISAEHGTPPIEIDGSAMQTLMDYPWPGNIRELRNLVERLMVLSDSRRITAEQIRGSLDDLDGASTEAPVGLPVRLGKTPEESSRDLLYWAILEVARDIKELKAFLMEGTSRPVRPMPVFQPQEPPRVEADAEFTDADVAEETGSVRSLRDVERDAIRRALEATGGHRKQAARLLDMAERTLYRKIRRYGL